MHNVLTDKLIRFRLSNGAASEASLPEVYAALMADEAETFPALRAHQRHAWHAFLVQLGAIAMHRAGLDTLPTDADEWRSIIRSLTPEWPGDEPWKLEVDDITQPAFMQPPARSQEREQDYKNAVATPDNLDMLLVAKNHDLKSEVAERAGIDDWIFSLITLQTMEGFGGAGNYGISRMNGGLGNRPAFSLAPSAGGLGAHVRRDISALLEFRAGMLNDNFQYPEQGGFALLWTLPWDGTEALQPSLLDILYIEVCRRIRLQRDVEGHLYGIRATSKTARVNGKDLKGRTGDPWTPTNGKRDGLPLTMRAGGFGYKRITEYLTEWRRPTLLHSTQSESRSYEPIQLVARAIVRGQGKTEGYYERVIPIEVRGGRRSHNLDRLQLLGQLARDRIVEVRRVERILSHAIQVFAARGDHERIKPEHRELARAWLNRLDEIVDSTFFEELLTELDAPENRDTSIRNGWLLNDEDKSGVINHARALLQDATDSLPCPAIHRYKARASAEGLFEGRIRGQDGFPDLFP